MVEHVEVPQARPFHAEPHVILYHCETSERIVRWPADAKELVATGEWSYTKPAPAPVGLHPEDVEQEPDPDAPAISIKRGPGRPRKNP